MLRLLPKDIVNCIYKIIHQNNIRNIVHEYQNRTCIVEYCPNLNENDFYLDIRLSRGVTAFNYRDICDKRIRYKYIYDKYDYVCAIMPERYVNSLTRQEFQLMSLPTN